MKVNEYYDTVYTMSAFDNFNKF